ncbi:MAG: hypothetical protein K8S16_03810 [Bacteroidales bacterium]|nr:hypothetical protein [Bacteroidales bacterium]
MQKLSTYILFLLLLSIAILSCRKNRPEPSWDVEVLSPLMLDTVFITDVISDTLIHINPDHLISFIFEEKLYDVNVDSLVRLPDTIFNWSFKVPVEITIPPEGTIIENFDWPLDFESMGLSDVKMESALIRSGKLRFEVINALDKDILCEFGINSAVKNETDTFLVSEVVSQGQVTIEEFDISEYRLNMVGLEDSVYSTLNYYIGLYNDTEPLLVEPTDSFVVNIRFKDIVIDYAKGYFGQNTFNFGPEQYPFSLFEDLDVAGFSIEEADVLLEIENNYGVEADYIIKELKAINSITGDEAVLVSPMVDSGLFINRAIETIPGSGNFIPAIHTFDFSQSNFGELFSIMPDMVSYTLEINTNVFGDSTNYDNFFYYDKPIQVFMEADVSKGVMIEDMFVENHMTWNGDGINLDKVKDGYLILAYTNGFPFSFDMNMYFLDDHYEVLDTLMYGEFIEAGLLNEDNSVAGATESRVVVKLTESLKLAMVEAKMVFYEILLNSAEGEHVKIYSDNTLGLKVIGDFKYLIEQ